MECDTPPASLLGLSGCLKDACRVGSWLCPMRSAAGSWLIGCDVEPLVATAHQRLESSAHYSHSLTAADTAAHRPGEFRAYEASVAQSSTD